MYFGVILFGSNFGTLCFLDLYVYFLHQIREVFFHYFFQISFQFLALLLLLLAFLSFRCWYIWRCPTGILYCPHFFLGGGFHSFFFLLFCLNAYFFLMFQIIDLNPSFIFHCWFPVDFSLFHLV